MTKVEACLNLHRFPADRYTYFGFLLYRFLCGTARRDGDRFSSLRDVQNAYRDVVSVARSVEK